MCRGIDALVRHLAPIELGEKRTKPVRVLVINPDRSCGCCRHFVLCFLVWSNEKPRLSEEARPAHGSETIERVRQVKPTGDESVERYPFACRPAQVWLSIQAWSCATPSGCRLATSFACWRSFLASTYCCVCYGLPTP